MCSFWVVFIGGKGSRIDPIPALSLCMRSAGFLPCHGVERGGQWALLALHDPQVSHHEGAWVASSFGFWQSTRGERERQEEIKKKKQKIYLPLLHVQGKKKKK
jgi:hypothetical protein